MKIYSAMIALAALFVLGWLVTAFQLAVLAHRGCHLERWYFSLSALSTVQIGYTYHISGWFVTFVMRDDTEDDDDSE